MGIYEHDETFAGLPIREYAPGEAVEDAAAVAYRFSYGYDKPAGSSLVGELGSFLADPGSRRAAALVFGQWDENDGSSAPVVAALAAASRHLPDLRAVFLGDITGEEFEISWIVQSDVGPLLAAYPALEELRVRGGQGLAFDCDGHANLRSLIIESGGLPVEVIRRVGAADFPRLEHLELWLGTEGYGGGATAADLAPILAGDRLPALRSLGLRDSEGADAIAAALAEAPILGRIEALDLSLGDLGDEGAVALLEGGGLAGLKRLDIHHHYLSDEVLDGLMALGVELRHDDAQGAEAEDRYIAVSE